ncbi:MAG TPA: YceI family protein [Methylibium sp.]|nr:YceI family protein [Methylibium sp.]
MRSIALALCAAGAAAGATAAPATYDLDPEHSFVHFEVLHFGTATIRGRLGPARGSVTLDREARNGLVSIELPMHSVSTGLAPFDAHLRRADLLDVEAHPIAWFVARRLRFDAADGAPAPSAVEGELTLRGVSLGLTLSARRFGCHPHPRLQREVCGGDFEGEIRRSAAGIDYGLPFVADRVRIVVQVEGLRREHSDSADRP